MVEPKPDQGAPDQTTEQFGEDAIAEAVTAIVLSRLARPDRLVVFCAAQSLIERIQPRILVEGVQPGLRFGQCFSPYRPFRSGRAHLPSGEPAKARPV